MNDLQKIFQFISKVGELKSTLRYSTLPSGRKESTAEHTWRMVLLSFIVLEEFDLNIDTKKAIKMAIIHDLPECISGDYDSYKVHSGELSKKQKEINELKAIKSLKNILPSKTGDEIYALWLEYEKGETRESKFVKAMDKIETLIQFSETGHKIYLNGHDFLAKYADEHVKNFPEIKEFLAIVKKELKKEYIKGGFPWKKEYDLT